MSPFCTIGGVATLDGFFLVGLAFLLTIFFFLAEDASGAGPTA